MVAHETMHLFPTRRRRRSSNSSSSGGARLGGSISVAFVAVCCSTLMLQVLTTTAPTPQIAFPPPSAADAKDSVGSGASELFDALLSRVSSSMRASLAGKSDQAGDDAVSMRLDDMRVSNVSVHRVRYVATDDSSVGSDGENDSEQESDESRDAVKPKDGDESGWNGSRVQATESFMGRWTRKVGFLSASRKRAEVTSVVVTWDDHFRTASGSDDDEEEDDTVDITKQSTTNNNNKSTKKKNVSGLVVTYELQHWVTGWGLDALWHPSNRKLAVADPFVVLSHLPQEHEVAFRVRMKVKKTTGLLSGLFATETDGPWSAVAVLSPSRDDALEAIFVFLASNKAFFLVLLMCIGSGSLVVFKLLVSHRFFWLRRARNSSTSALATTSSSEFDDLSAASQPPKSATRRSGTVSTAAGGGELEQEIKDLRQELADSEAEVHKLMLFRGYGVERLTTQELALVEQELCVTLQRIQKLQKAQQASPRLRGSSEDDTEEDESELQQQQQQVRHRGSTGSAHARRRRLGAVFEVDEAAF